MKLETDVRIDKDIRINFLHQSVTHVEIARFIPISIKVIARPRIAGLVSSSQGQTGSSLDFPFFITRQTIYF